ncbi:Protein disulfide-isomerase tmx3 [Paramecium bursaria]
MPTWKKFADEYQGNYSQIAAVNCEKHYELASKMSISGVPTFILFTLQQQKYYFEGDRTKEQFYNFMVENYSKGEQQEAVPYQVSYVNIWIALIFGISLIIAVFYVFRKQENKEYQNVSQSQMVEMQETEFQI